MTRGRITERATFFVVLLLILGMVILWRRR